MSGGVTVLIWKQITGLDIANVYPILKLYEIVPGFILSSIAIVIASKLDKEPSKEITDTFDSVKHSDI